VGAAIAAVVAACLSEVASQFTDTGGPYLTRARHSERLWHIQIGWLTWLTPHCLGFGGGQSLRFYLGEVLPAVRFPLMRAGILVAMIGFLGGRELSRVEQGASSAVFLPARSC